MKSLVLDGHIHVRDGEEDVEEFSKSLKATGMDGGIILSRPPASFPAVASTLPAAERLEHVLKWCKAVPNTYPFFWIDPLEEDALEQVDAAVRRGILGFKVICDRYYPDDPRAMTVFRAIAKNKRPILFHSGILWDAKDSSKYQRPAGFEALLEVDGLRFSLAHISWPWCDELIAVYGKFLNAYERRPELSVEMFIDTTPGTPKIYRREALTKVYTVGYDVANNVFFGSDGSINEYNVKWTREWIDSDRRLLEELGQDQSVIQAYFGDNLRRFVGLSDAAVFKKGLRPGE